MSIIYTSLLKTTRTTLIVFTLILFITQQFLCGRPGTRSKVLIILVLVIVIEVISTVGRFYRGIRSQLPSYCERAKGFYVMHKSDRICLKSFFNLTNKFLVLSQHDI